MARTSFLTNCPRCGYIAEAWTEDGVTAKIPAKCAATRELCPIPILRKGPGESDNIYS